MLPRLEPRGAISTPMVYLTPVLAVALTLVAGVIMFAALGFDPGRSLYVYCCARRWSRPSLRRT